MTDSPIADAGFTGTEFSTSPASTAPTGTGFTRATPAGAAPGGRPAFVPEKFWDAAGRRIRVEDLARSYRALEQKLGRVGEARRASAAPGTSPQDTQQWRDPFPSSDSPGAAEPSAARRGFHADAAFADPRDDDGDTVPRLADRDAAHRGDADADTAGDGHEDNGEGDGTAADGDEPGALDTSVPDAPEDYRVHISHPLLGRDAEIDGLLHAAGFNQAQAQLVYDLAAERVAPALERLSADYDKRLGQAKLEAHFGGAERYAATARQVRGWGERHLPKALFDTLAASPDGIVALHHLMRGGEPRFVSGAAPDTAPSQHELEALVRDPRYWRDGDPALKKRIEDGFRRLYPGE